LDFVCGRWQDVGCSFALQDRAGRNRLFCAMGRYGTVAPPCPLSRVSPQAGVASRSVTLAESIPDAGEAQLLAVVEVEHDQRVQCGHPGSGHFVYKAIHIVQDGAELLVLGSKCFKNRYGQGTLGSPKFGSGFGRPLTLEERGLLMANTALLLQRF